MSHIAHWICHPHVKPIWEVKWLKKFYNMWVKSYGCNLIFFFAKNVVLPTKGKGYKCVWVISWYFTIHYVRYECMMYIKSLKAVINRCSKMPWKAYWPRWFSTFTTIQMIKVVRFRLGEGRKMDDLSWYFTFNCLLHQWYSS